MSPVNPMLSKLMSGTVNQNNLGMIKSMIGMVKSAGNPMAMMSQLASRNPQMRRAMDMAGNGNPQQVFFEECQKRGVDPQKIFNMLK